MLLNLHGTLLTVALGLVIRGLLGRLVDRIAFLRTQGTNRRLEIRGECNLIFSLGRIGCTVQVGGILFGRYIGPFIGLFGDRLLLTTQDLTPALLYGLRGGLTCRLGMPHLGTLHVDNAALEGTMYLRRSTHLLGGVTNGVLVTEYGSIISPAHCRLTPAYDKVTSRGL